uniref:Lipoprotein n=1 Tax=Nitratidesulfovibrio vulgaris (strain DSM 19637 / Miyazaki F) TaxID=883 RepID=B8DMI8_NITV9
MNDDCKTMTRRNRCAARGLSALVALLVLAALLAGCSEKLQLYRPGALAMVTGTVSFRQRILLPLSVQGEVRLLDVTDGGEGVELARVELPAPVRVPAPYRIDFDAARIDQRRNYVVEATLFEPGTGGGPGRVWFRTPTPQYVLTHGNPVYLELMLEMVR